MSIWWLDVEDESIVVRNDLASSSSGLVPTRFEAAQHFPRRPPPPSRSGVSKMAFSELLKAATALGPDQKIPGAAVMAADASGSDT